MRLELNLDFEERFAADRFFFGVAYAPYCEGGGLNRPDGFKNTDWTRRAPGDTSDGEGIRFWTNYADHVRAGCLARAERLPDGHRVGALPAVRVHRADRPTASGMPRRSTTTPTWSSS